LAPEVNLLDVPTVRGLDSGLADAIAYWAAQYGVSEPLMDALAQCESSYGTNPNAYDGSSGFLTAFQFERATWYGSPPGQRGIAYEHATDWDAAEATAYYLSIGESWRWPHCTTKWQPSKGATS